MIPTRFFVVSFPIVTLMVGVPSHTWAQSGYIISDDHGGYAGEISSDGHISDSRGGYAGEISSNGHISDSRGGYAGEISSNGHVSDSRGGYAGEVGPSNGTGFSKEQMLAALRLLHKAQ